MGGLGIAEMKRKKWDFLPFAPQYQSLAQQGKVVLSFFPLEASQFENPDYCVLNPCLGSQERGSVLVFGEVGYLAGEQVQVGAQV